MALLVRRIEIAKPDGGTRQLGTDCVIQQTIAQVLTAIFDPDFSEHSFGFRPSRNVQQTVVAKIKAVAYF